VVIGADGVVSGHFSAGAVDLTGIDTKRDGKMDFTGDAAGTLREPDAVKWVDADHFVTANEGDYEGGSRGFTIFNRDGTVVFESGSSLEQAIAAMGHYPDHRNKKGAEIESVEVAQFDGVPHLFVASERSSLVAVYDLTDPAAPVLKQILPSGVSPEGMVAIPSRNLFATANEVDLREDGLAPAHVMVYERAEGTAAYPMITSAGSDPLIGWAALSGLAAGAEGTLYAVSDSVLSGAPTIYTIDATQTPAKITAALTVTRGGDAAQKLDLEGIVGDGDGGFWLASEGRSDRMIPHAIYHVDAEGAIDAEIPLPEVLLDQEIRFGFEGITMVGDVLWLAVQREWQDDPSGMVKLLAYNTAEETWGAVHYPLDASSGADGAWVGLSEITAHGDYLYLIERDNQIAGNAAIKKLTRVALAGLAPAELGGPLPVVTKELVRDLMTDVTINGGYTAEKVEGFTVDAAGNGWLVTDNDGTNDSSGETLFWSIGAMN